MSKSFRAHFFIRLSSHKGKQERRENTEKGRNSNGLHFFLRGHVQEMTMGTSKNIIYRRLPKQLEIRGWQWSTQHFRSVTVNCCGTRQRKSEGGIKDEHKNKSNAQRPGTWWASQIRGRFLYVGQNEKEVKKKKNGMVEWSACRLKWLIVWQPRYRRWYQGKASVTGRDTIRDPRCCRSRLE